MQSPSWSPPQGHSACNKIYVQELDASPVGALRVQSSLQEERSQWLPLAARPGGRHMRQELAQSQPLSLIMWLSSMMYFPSLYFWLLSKACSYFQPKVVLQFSQWMSATA